MAPLPQLLSLGPSANFSSTCSSFPSASSNCGCAFHSSRLPTITALQVFRLKITCQPFNWIAIGRKKLLKAARRKNLRHLILNASADPNKDLLAGPQYVHEQSAIPDGKWNSNRILVVGEGVCIVASAAACLVYIMNHRSQEARLVASSTSEPFVNTRFQNLPVWQSFFVLAALLINAILRARQWQSMGHLRNKTNKFRSADSGFEERIRKLEEEVASAVTIIRVLSKQLEKLGVRFRVTRQSLRDPIQETAILAEKTSDAVNTLAIREDALEKGLDEIQHVLLGMQENQVKQLELILALGNLVKERTGRRVDKPVRGSQNDHKGAALKHDAINDQTTFADGRYNRLIHKLGGFIRNTQLPKGEDMVDTKAHANKVLSQRATLQGLELGGGAGIKSKNYRDDSSKLSSMNNIVQNRPEKVDFWLNNSASASSVLQMEEPQYNTCDFSRANQFFSEHKGGSTSLDSEVDKDAAVSRNDNKASKGNIAQSIPKQHKHMGSESKLKTSSAEENLPNSPYNMGSGE